MSDHVLRWVKAAGPPHPVIVDLQSRPGDWAVIDQVTLASAYDIYKPTNDLIFICQGHERVEVKGLTVDELPGGYLYEVRARWIPDDEWAAKQAATGRSEAMKELTRVLREVFNP